MCALPSLLESANLESFGSITTAFSSGSGSHRNLREEGPGSSEGQFAEFFFSRSLRLRRGEEPSA